MSHDSRTMCAPKPVPGVDACFDMKHHGCLALFGARKAAGAAADGTLDIICGADVARCIGCRRRALLRLAAAEQVLCILDAQKACTCTQIGVCSLHMAQQ